MAEAQTVQAAPINSQWPTKSRFQKRIDDMRREIGNRDRTIEELHHENRELRSMLLGYEKTIEGYKQALRRKVSHHG